MRPTGTLIVAAAALSVVACGNENRADRSQTATTTTQQATRPKPARPRCDHPGGLQSLPCLDLPRRLAPPDAQASAQLLFTESESRALVSWSVGDTSGFGIWRQAGGRWEHMYANAIASGCGRALQSAP